MKKTTTLGALALAILGTVGSAQAVTYTVTDGNNQATAEVLTSYDNIANKTTITIELTNLTTPTVNYTDVLTGFFTSDFTGLQTSNIIARAGVLRTIASDGSFVDGGNFTTWGFEDVSGDNALTFHPVADEGIVGPAFGPGTDYAGSNPSVRGNAGHNPMIGETALFTLLVDGNVVIDSDNATFYFGSDLIPSDGECIDCGGDVPEPASLSIIGLGAAGLLLRRRKVA